MKFGYVVRPQADRDIDEIADYLVEQSGLDVGLRFLSEVYETFALLGSRQDVGWHCKVRHPQLMTARTFRVSERFDKFLIFYQPYRDRIEILRVLHGAQDLLALFNREGVG
ncbi:MAG: type II toxin-antitoxin system RelE/ParE family toxin [Bryobacterales bacterium]|nr:type II toxin-antitoxin system RelE/ParE family toxin [Bryobacterales bacterium]